VIQELERPESWDPLQVAEDASPGLQQLYDRMVDQIPQLIGRNSEICQLLLSTATVAYRPLHLPEMVSLCGLAGSTSVLVRNVGKIVAMCRSFLAIRDDQIYLIHQSAKDYLSDKERAAILPSKDNIHYDIFSQSLKLLSLTIKRDMYGLTVLGFPIDEVRVPANDPLATTRYSCIYWVDHLCDWCSDSPENHGGTLQNDGAVDILLRKNYLYWLEALSLCKSISRGVISMAKLEKLVQACYTSNAVRCLTC
jgi:hypothetical protein